MPAALPFLAFRRNFIALVFLVYMTQPVVVVCLLGLREPHALPRGESDGNDISDLDPLAMDPACENLRKREWRRNFIVLFFLVYVARPVVVTAVIYD